MNIVSGPKRSFAFYYAVKHLTDEGATVLYVDSEGDVVRANYCGQMIDGFPGRIQDGVVVRPPNHEAYSVVGEFGGPVPGKLRKIIGYARPGRLDFSPS